MVTLAQLAAHPLIRARYRALADAAGQSASPQIRHVATIGGNLLQRPRCWYFRSLHHHCVRKGGATCFAFAGENQYHAMFGHNGCAIVHPSTAATALVAFNARVELVRPQGRQARRRAGGLLRDARQRHRARERSQAGRNPDCRDTPAIGARHSFGAPAAGRAWIPSIGRSPTWRSVIDMDADGICRQASVVLGAAAPVPYRAKGAESALVGQADFRRHRAQRGARGHRRCRTPEQERLQAAGSSRRW